MKDRKPGENFTEEAKPFVEEIKEMARIQYQKLLDLGHDLGQKLQKTFNPSLGINGSSTSTKTKVVQKQDDTKDDD